MNVLINEMFLFSSLIVFSSEETSGGDGATRFLGPSVLSEPPSCAPLGVAAVERNQHLEKQYNTDVHVQRKWFGPSLATVSHRQQ